MNKPFDCDHTCDYCMAEGCPERKQPYYRTISTTFPAYKDTKVYVELTPTIINNIIIDGKEFYLINGELIEKTLFI